MMNSFNAGELSPLLNAREDLSKYHGGLSQMENMIPLPQGAAQKRPGTVYVAGSKSNTKVRLLPFEFSTDQAYAHEYGNQYIRFYTNNAQISGGTGSEDLSALDNIIAHWKLNDDLATTVVIDADGATHNGVSSLNTEVLHEIGRVGTGCFNFFGSESIEVTDHADLDWSAGGTANSQCTVTAWIFVTDFTAEQHIITKYAHGLQKQWKIYLDSSERLVLYFWDFSNADSSYAQTDASLEEGWNFIACYGDSDEATPAEGDFKLYVNAVLMDDTQTTGGSFVKVQENNPDVKIGRNDTVAAGFEYYFQSYIDNIAFFKDELSSSEITALYNDSGAYEVVTPYLTADLFNLKYKQSADVLYITHPDYEPHKLLRRADSWWQIVPLGVESGPFLDENTTITKTITPSAVTGSITLTASGFNPFVDGTTAGHEPSGSASTSKSQTGALFKLVQPLATAAYEEILSNNYTADQTEDVSWMDCGSIANGVTWYLTTLGTWTGTLEVQRNYTIGAAHGAAGWETVFTYQSTDDRNVTTADYRVILTASGDAAEPCQVYFRISDIDHVGIVEITAVTDSQTATATVIKTLADTTATHRWSEGAWSNYRGWPRAVTFFEDRLVFGGNTNQPDTVWLSATGDYENMEAGTDDDEAMLFTLSSRQVNVIEWMVGKDNLIIGTSGAEWTLRGGTDEPLTPSNVKAEQQSSHGSANLQATLASESILFFQRGAEKMRELAYNWESDSYVAPEMTLLVPEVTGDGITSVDYQKIPNSILWCVRDDGEMAVFSYERAEQVTSWSRFITDGLFESVIVINGDPEDQVWVSVNRTIGGSTKRYIEYFSARDFGTDVDDAYFVDSGITYDDVATTTITGLTHLEAETVAVLGDGAIQTSQTVSSGQITITQASTVQAGLPFTVQMKTMPLSFLGAGTSIIGRIKRVSGLTAEYYNSGDFEYGKDSSNKFTISVTGMDSDITPRKTFPAGYGKKGQVFIYQQSPEPFTLVSLGLDFEVF
jgi:hypothetical protein